MWSKFFSVLYIQFRKKTKKHTYKVLNTKATAIKKWLYFGQFCLTGSKRLVWFLNTGIQSQAWVPLICVYSGKKQHNTQNKVQKAASPEIYLRINSVAFCYDVSQLTCAQMCVYLEVVRGGGAWKKQHIETKVTFLQ